MLICATAVAVLWVAVHRAHAVAPALCERARAMTRVRRALPGPCWYLAHLTVAPHRRGGGLGTALVAALPTRADAIVLRAGDPDAVRLYRRLRFADVAAAEFLLGYE